MIKAVRQACAAGRQIRAAQRPRFPRPFGLGACLASIAAVATAGPLRASPFDGPATLLDSRNAVGLAVQIGIVIFATLLSVLHVRQRQSWATRERRLSAEVAELRSAAERADLLFGAERQVVVTWSGLAADVQIEGDPTVVGEGATARKVLAFGSWLVPSDAARLEAALDELRRSGRRFRFSARTLARSHVEAEGRAFGGRVLLRLRDVGAEHEALLLAQAELESERGGVAALRGLLDAIADPVWCRRTDGRLGHVNRAYCAAVNASGPEEVAARGLELLDRADRAESARLRGEGGRFNARLAAVVDGSRRVLDITETSAENGSIGVARDVSDLEAARAELRLQAQTNARTLDQLPTAVAMFDGRATLTFHNAAYRQLWNLDAAFLDSGPSESEILDRLRGSMSLPEQADYRRWKSTWLENHRAVEAEETWWHLPDRRALRVFWTPNAQGGITYLFDDVSDRLQLESRYNALISVRSETLDGLAEGVALFGADGRLKLFNPAFVHLWRLDRAALEGEPHIEAVSRLCADLAPGDVWDDLRSEVSGFTEMRLGFSCRMERRDGKILACSARPLPDGATLITFSDVTASVNMERNSLVREQFVKHVSYELRTPLTHIIGFAELLSEQAVGPLNERQSEYATLIKRASGALLADINDKLQLLSYDAGRVQLRRQEVDLRATVQAAAAGVEDRLAESGITLGIEVAEDIGRFVGDAERIRQVLFNLLSMAAGFSSEGDGIQVFARRLGAELALGVADEGRAFSERDLEGAFDAVETYEPGDPHWGIGLGFSIVRSIVELHGGRVDLAPNEGRGARVTCWFPLAGTADSTSMAAE